MPPRRRTYGREDRQPAASNSVVTEVIPPRQTLRMSTRHSTNLNEEQGTPPPPPASSPPPPAQSPPAPTEEASEEDIESDDTGSEPEPLPEVPYEEQPIPANVQVAEAKVGDYPIEAILERGWSWHPDDKKWYQANLVRHRDLVYFDRELEAPALQPQKKVHMIDTQKYQWAHRIPDQLAANEEERRAAVERARKRGEHPARPCRFCHKVFARSDSANRHEKNCKAPGGPKHKCNRGCPKDCAGREPWVQAPGKKRGPRPRGPPGPGSDGPSGSSPPPPPPSSSASALVA